MATESEIEEAARNFKYWATREKRSSKDILDGFLADAERMTNDPAETIEIFCALKNEVANAGVTTFPSTPSDCCCPSRTFGWANPASYHRDSGDEIRYIIRVVSAALAEVDK